MGPALRRRNVVYKTVCVVAVRIIMLHRNLDVYVVFLSLTINDLIIKSRLTLIQVRHEFFDSALVMNLFDQFLFSTLISKTDF